MTVHEKGLLFACILGLKRDIIAVSLAQTQTEYEMWSATQFTRQLTFCSMARIASAGHRRKAAPENFKCPGAREVFGFTEPNAKALSGERLFNFGLYADRHVAQQVQMSMARLERPCHGVLLSPLKLCTSLPDSVLFLVDGYQTMRLVQAWAYHHGVIKEVSITGNRGICSEGVARPLASNSLHLSALCSNTRHIAAWKDQELGAGLPATKLDLLLSGLLATIPAAEPPARQQAILDRCTQSGLSCSIPTGIPYFMRGTSRKPGE